MNEDTLEVVETSSRSIEAIERAEIDIQIATARRFPRALNTKTISEQIALHATINEETARECYYAIPRAGIVIQGPSVRLSEIVANCFGNLHIAGRIIDHDLVSRSVTAQAVAWDLQNNVRRTAEWAEPITQKASDAVKMTKLVAISKAERNAIFKVVPRVIWEAVLTRCITAAIGDAASLQTRLANACKAFAPFGIVPEQILHTFGVDSLEKLTKGDLANLLGMHTALKEGTATIDELFKPLPKKETISDAKESPKDSTGNGKPVESMASEPEPAQEPPKRQRGRPRKTEQNETSQTTNNLPESAPEPQNEAPAPKGEDASSNVAAHDRSDDANPKSTVIAKIRKKLEDGNVSEPRLLALLHKWSWSENPAQPLEDFTINELELVEKRFDQILKSV